MASVNEVTLIGNVGADPDIKYTAEGVPIASFPLATNETWRASDGSERERTEWHRIDAFGKPADIARRFIKKGMQIYVKGSLKYETYTDKEGIERTSTKIRVNGFNSKIMMLGKAQNSAPEIPETTPDI